MKIVGIGLNKTGTKTLRACLKHWRFKHRSADRDAFRLYSEGRITEILSIVAAHDSFEDWPWPLLYREIDAAFPGSRFILTRRRNADVWFESLCAHAERTGPTAFRARVYGHPMPHGHREDHVRVYHEHLTAVREWFRGRPGDLLEVCWEDGDGWPQLADFLGLPAPDIPFPHANARSVARRRGVARAKNWLRNRLRR